MKIDCQLSGVGMLSNVSSSAVATGIKSLSKYNVSNGADTEGKENFRRRIMT